MDIYLIRHTEVATEKGICYGQSEVALSLDFEKHLGLLKKKIEGVIPDLVFSSPALRCTRLAQNLILSDNLVLDDRLRELNFGEWELKAWADLPQDELKRWTENYIEEAPPGGETYRRLFTRTKSFWEEEVVPLQKDCIFLIAHGGVIRSILSLLLEIPLHKSFSLQVDLAGISKVSVTDSHYSVRYINL